MNNIVMLMMGLVLLTGCTSMRLEDFSQSTPEMVLEEYFNGNLTAYGLVKDRSGKITSTFRAAFVGHWNAEGIGKLEEVFVYDNGTVQEREWTFTPAGQNRYVGTAPDIVGQADLLVNGNTLKMEYVIRVPYKDRMIDLAVTDWLHLQPDGVILNHSYMRKFGLRVAELVITIIKDFPEEQTDES